jgi:hypothetical protein
MGHLSCQQDVSNLVRMLAYRRVESNAGETRKSMKEKSLAHDSEELRTAE